MASGNARKQKSMFLERLDLLLRIQSLQAQVLQLCQTIRGQEPQEEYTDRFRLSCEDLFHKRRLPALLSVFARIQPVELDSPSFQDAQRLFLF